MPNQTVIVPAKQPWSGLIKKGQVLTIKDTYGQQAVDFLCYDSDNISDRYSATNTVKVQGNVYVGKGTILHADSGKPFLELLRILSENTTRFMVAAATPITNFVTVQKRRSPVTQTLQKSLKNVAWTSPQLLQT